MAPAVTKAALSKLRREMHAAGCDALAIATEMQRTFALRPREAHRHAHGWSQEEAAHAYNEAEGSGSAPMTGARISAYERWPNGGERPSVRVLVVLARAYGVHVGALVDFRDRQNTPAADQHLLDELLAVQQPETIDPAPEPAAQQPPDTAVELDLTAPEETQLVDSARQSAEFARRAGRTNVGPADLDQLDADVDSIARRYLTDPLVPLITDVLRLRNTVWEYLDGRQYPGQTSHLYRLAGQACGLLASASSDLGHYDAADTHARTASLCADLAQDPRLQGWIANTRSLIAYWSGRPRRAAEYAEYARHCAGHGIELVRAHAYEARARARLGDEQGTRLAIGAAVEARHHTDDPDDYVGMFAFPLANQQRVAGSSLVVLGQPLDGVLHLDDALAGYGSQSYAHTAVTRLDLVLAHLQLGDLDAAREFIAPVLGLPAERRLAGVSRRTEGLQRILAGNFRAIPAARALAEEIEDFLEHNAARALPGPTA